MRERTRRSESMGWTDQVREFTKDVRAESAKVSWPTRLELRDSTIVVIVTVLIVSAFVGIVDRLLSFGVTKLFG
jgi:preprotein translocase subunit SecE